MDTELVKLLVDGGVPSILLSVILIHQWRKREDKPANGNGGVSFPMLMAVVQDLKEISRQMNELDRENAASARARHRELLGQHVLTLNALRQANESLDELKKRVPAA